MHGWPVCIARDGLSGDSKWLVGGEKGQVGGGALTGATEQPAISASIPCIPTHPNNTHPHTNVLQCSQSANITAHPASNSPDYDINNSLSDKDLIVLSSLLGMSYIGHITALHQYIGLSNESTPACYYEERIQHCVNLPALAWLKYSCFFTCNLPIYHFSLTPARQLTQHTGAVTAIITFYVTK